MGFDIGQMFTPPSSKSPWTAMTHGSTGSWAEDFEPWGPAIMSGVSYIPVVGQVASAAGGAMGMGGRGTGYIGSDYGNANWGTTIGGAIGGLFSQKKFGGNLAQGFGSLLDSNTYTDQPDASARGPAPDDYNTSLWGGIVSGVGSIAGDLGSYYGGAAGGQVGGRLRGPTNIYNAGTEGQNVMPNLMSNFGVGSFGGFGLGQEPEVEPKDRDNFDQAQLEGFQSITQDTGIIPGSSYTLPSAPTAYSPYV